MIEMACEYAGRLHAKKILFLLLVPLVIFLLYVQDSSKAYKCVEEETMSMTYPKTDFPGHFLQVNDDEIYLYSAYLDERFNREHIRIFGMQNRRLKDRLHCYFYYDGGKIETSPERIYAIYPNWPSANLQYHAYYYGCKFPQHAEHKIRKDQVGLFLPGSPIETRIPVQVLETPLGGRGDLAVCVKAVWGDRDPKRIVEWIEMNRILGVQKFVLYDAAVNGAARRVLNYYQTLGVVDLIPFPYILKMLFLMRGNTSRHHQSRDDMLMEQAYLVSLNDCMYRYRQSYQHIMVIDLDEIIVPMEKESIPHVLQRAARSYPNAAAYTFSTAWHFDKFGPKKDPSVPKYLYMQRYLKRTAITNSQPKTIFLTDRYVSINWHSVVMMPSKFNLQGNVYLPWKMYGFVHHYRGRCESKFTSHRCKSLHATSVNDKIMPTYLKQIKRQTLPVLQRLMIQ